MLKSIAQLALLVVLLLVVGSARAQEPNHAEVVTKVLDVLERLSKSLATITTQETADAAKVELGKLANEWTATREQAEKLPPPSREDKDRLEKEFKSKLDSAQKKLFGEVVRVQVIPGGVAALQEIRGVIARKSK